MNPRPTAFDSCSCSARTPCPNCAGPDRARQTLALGRGPPRCPPHSPFLSVITIHELQYGLPLTERSDPPQGGLLRQWLDHSVAGAFVDRALVSMTRWPAGLPPSTFLA
jgi:hypothetical protein